MEVGGGGEAHIGLSPNMPTEFPARVWYLPGGGEVPDEWLVTQGMRAWGTFGIESIPNWALHPTDLTLGGYWVVPNTHLPSAMPTYARLGKWRGCTKAAAHPCAQAARPRLSVLPTICI